MIGVNTQFPEHGDKLASKRRRTALPADPYTQLGQYDRLQMSPRCTYRRRFHCPFMVPDG